MVVELDHLHAAPGFEKEIPQTMVGDGVVLKDGRYRLSPGIEVFSDVREFEARYDNGRRLARMAKRKGGCGRVRKGGRALRGAIIWSRTCTRTGP